MPTKTGADPTVQTDAAATESRARRVRVVEVIEETADARSFVVEPGLGNPGPFDYRPGQFLTVRAEGYILACRAEPVTGEITIEY